VTVAVVAGLVAGFGIWLAWTGLRPLPEPLGAALSRIERRPHESRADSRAKVDERDERIGRFLLRNVPMLDRAIESTAVDLRIVGRTPEEQAARVGSYMALALVLGPWVGFVGWVVGLDLPVIVPGVIALGGAVGGLFMPFVSLRREANERRQVFSRSLSSWCDVVVMNLAAGRGVEQAMETAAAAGTCWAFAELRGALRGGYVRGEPPWVALERLGVELGVSDLGELASTIAMAGEEGAAVRTSVSAKARTIRERMIAETEMTAAAVTERMSLPSILLVLGFLVFLGYPALNAMFQIGR
jgi:Flp pilus assembly protein TadB